MKRQSLFCIVLVVFGMSPAFGQGSLLLYNPGAPTRIGSIDGPLAGPGILGQFLVGATSDSLTPIGFPLEHTAGGIVFGGVGTVPQPPRTYVQVQLVAWNSEIWGDSLENVPLEWRGTTDIVPVFLSLYPTQPAFSPVFTQPAIVPVPEPGVVSLFCLGCGIAALRLFRKKR